MGTRLPANVEHISVDFLSKSEDIAAALREAGVSKIDYVFFFWYIQVAPEPGKPLWSNAEAMYIKNTELLANFLSADVDRIFSVLELTLSGAIFCNMSMDKARRLGFFGTVNSCNSILQVIQEFVDLRMMPPLQA